DLFSNCYGVLTNSGRLIDATGRIPRDRKETLNSGFALVEVLFCYFSYPVGRRRLHSLFGILLCKMHSISRHSVTSVIEAQSWTVCFDRGRPPLAGWSGAYIARCVDLAAITNYLTRSSENCLNSQP